VCTFSDHTDAPMCASWNSTGSLLATAGKDKTMRIFDPRDVKAAASVTTTGNKKNSVFFADNHGLLVGVVFSERSGRQLVCWDQKKLGAHLFVSEIDNAAGVFIPHYEPDNSLLFLGAKGGAGVRYYEITATSPYFNSLSEFSDNESQKGLAWMPKRALDVKLCEIGRCLRLMKDEVVPVSFQVPRKSDLFQQDLFPDTYAGVAALSATQWLSGQNAQPMVKAMKPGADQTPRSAGAAPAAAPAASYAKPGGDEVAALKAENAQLKARIAELEAQLAAKS